MKIIFAQGNPEPKYTGSRHNVGFEALNALAGQTEAKWQKKTKLQALVAAAMVNDQKVLLVKPTTYYNQTGISVRKVVDFYNIDIQNDLLVIYDDLALPFGTIRTRRQGSDAGNNGIKSINAAVGPNYARIRIGTCTDQRDYQNDADFVLKRFNHREQTDIDQTITPAVLGIIDSFCSSVFRTTSYNLLDK